MLLITKMLTYQKSSYRNLVATNPVALLKDISNDAKMTIRTISVTRWQVRFSTFGLYNHENFANIYRKIGQSMFKMLPNTY